MTDKQIIYNGVDVAGCEYLGLYKECKLKCGSCYPVDCSDNPNCYYKQLKKKEQECGQLKSVRDIWMSKCEQETKTSEFFQDRFDDLKRTLIEIKKIAEILTPMTDEYENCYDRDRCFECDFTEDCSYFNTKRIIQICDEVIDE